jgi:hypothetical protein
LRDSRIHADLRHSRSSADLQITKVHKILRILLKPTDLQDSAKLQDCGFHKIDPRALQIPQFGDNPHAVQAIHATKWDNFPELGIKPKLHELNPQTA